MRFTKILVGLLFICSSAAAHADDADSGRIIGGIIGGIVGGALGAGGEFPHRPPYPFPFPGHGGPHRPHPPFPPGPFPPGPGPTPGPGPGPGPAPIDDLCVGTYQDSQGNALRFSPQRDGNVYVEFFSNRNYSLAGWGTCDVNGPSQTQFQFTLQFGGRNHLNTGVLYYANDGRAYLQGSQDGGPTYYYSR